MKKLLALAVLAGAAACSTADSPTQPLPLVVPPQLATVVGGSATWYFDATVSSAADGSLVGLPVTGSITFAVTGDDLFPGDPTWGEYPLDATITYTVGGNTYTVTGGPALADATTSSSFSGQGIVVSGSTPDFPTDGLVAEFDLPNPLDSEDFYASVVPTPDVFSVFKVFNPYSLTNRDLNATLTALYTQAPPSNDPATKDDCKKGGWADYGFRNQGQCVRFIETGKDSR